MATDRTTDWTPDMPLRADATDEQMGIRMAYLYECALLDPDASTHVVLAITREFAAACVAAPAYWITTGRGKHVLVDPNGEAHFPRCSRSAGA